MLFRKRKYTDEQLTTFLKGAASDRDTALRFIFVESGWRRIAFRIIKSLGGGVQDAEDAIQEAIIVLDEHVRTGKYRQTANLKNYFLGICRGRWHANRRSVHRVDWTPEPLFTHTADPDEPESILLKNEQKDTLRAVLDQIDERCRELLHLYKLAYSMDEIAAALGFGNANAARQRTHHCRQKLAKMLEKMPFFDDFTNREK